MAFILAIILIAAWLRLWQLNSIPFGVEYDEAYNGLDALWMVENRHPYLFVPSNHGREALFLYPIAFFTTLLGATPFSLRFSAAIVGILAVPLTYRLAKELFYDHTYRDWIALAAATGLTVSLWHLSMSRVAFRSILIPTFFSLMAYLFWKGWRLGSQETSISRQLKRPLWYFVGAGITLGLSQYAYLSARVFPMVWLLFGGSMWLMTTLRSRPFFGGTTSRRIALLKQSTLWGGLIIMGGVSLLVVIPQLLIFLNSSDAFIGRPSQISYSMEWSASGLTDFTKHLGQGLSLFVGGSDPRIRHHLTERSVFDGLMLVGFWTGAIIALIRWHRAASIFLLISLCFMLLPSLLSVDPIHNLRASGILPAFFILMAAGLIWLINFGVKYLLPTLSRSSVGVLAVGVILVGSGGPNSFDYFARWANDRSVYQEYEGSYGDLADGVMSLSNNADILLTYADYSHPSARYLLDDLFEEEFALPFSPFERLADRREVIYMRLDSDNEASLPLVWLTRDSVGQGRAYLTNSLRLPDNNTFAQPVLNRQGDAIGRQIALNRNFLESAVGDDNAFKTAFIWDGRIELRGFSLASQTIMAGQPGQLRLYWSGLEDADLTYNIFLQILDAQGQPITQANERIIGNSKNYYQNRKGIVYWEYPLWVGPDTPPGLYLIRVGLFDVKTGQRLSITTTDGYLLGDQVTLTPFYVQSSQTDPRSPDVQLQASLANKANLLGYSIVRPDQTVVDVKLYWQSIKQMDTDYTTFVQLLDSQNRVISQWDAQPLNGLYPTSFWRPGQIVIDQFTLFLDKPLKPGSYRVVTGMYDLTTNARLVVYDGRGQSLPDNMITLDKFKFP